MYDNVNIGADEAEAGAREAPAATATTAANAGAHQDTKEQGEVLLLLFTCALSKDVIVANCKVCQKVYIDSCCVTGIAKG